VEYEWNEAKAAGNLRKHGVSFTAAARALEDPRKVEIFDDRFDYDEKMRLVSRVKVLRQRLGMTRAEFAEAFRLPIATLLDWEQHRGMPDAPARALLLAIERDPKVMRQLLADTAA
jgi:putative transcriptional regulator